MNQLPPAGLRTIIESPLGSRPDGTRASPEEFKRNQEYALRCMRHSFSIGEAPFASHVLYPLVLEDATPDERRQGMQAGFAWGEVAQQVAVYVDYDVTPGMIEGINRARRAGQRVRFRRIGKTVEPCTFETSEGSLAACDLSPRSVRMVDVMSSYYADNPPLPREDESPFEYASHELGEPVG